MTNFDGFVSGLGNGWGVALTSARSGSEVGIR